MYNELTQLLTTQLPVLYSEVESLAVHVESALLYYQAFRHCTIVPRRYIVKLVMYLKFFTISLCVLLKYCTMIIYYAVGVCYNFICYSNCLVMQ